MSLNILVGGGKIDAADTGEVSTFSIIEKKGNNKRERANGTANRGLVYREMSPQNSRGGERKRN